MQRHLESCVEASKQLSNHLEEDMQMQIKFKSDIIHDKVQS